jgi:hypothetical protein
MKRIYLTTLFLWISILGFGQFKFDLGIKGGVNFSKVSLDLDDYSAESITKSHFGAFGRLGFGRIFIQPEVYFTGKGGDVTSSLGSTVASFNFKSVDVPVLLGLRLIKGKLVGLHLTGGPVFSNITSKDIEGFEGADKSFYKNHYMGIQYGLGLDIWKITLDARMENGLGEFYKHTAGTGKNNTFMISAGFKFL